MPCAVLGALFAHPSTLHAYPEPTATPIAGVLSCACHNEPQMDLYSGGHPEAPALCMRCHAYTGVNFPLGQTLDPDAYLGPHGNYRASTSKCAACHSIHVAPAPRLLPAATVVGTCWSCHDGSGGFGVYGAILAQTGSPPGSSHRIEATSSVPGGDALTGGAASRVFKGPGGRVTCGDCHSVHGSDLVVAFQGDRMRVRADHYTRPTSKLLRRRPTGATTSTAEYGSDWCAACHAGRHSGGIVNNHPVDSRIVTSTPFIYRNVAASDLSNPASFGWYEYLGLNARGYYSLGGNYYGSGGRHTPKAGLDVYEWGGGNGGYLMPYPRSEYQRGHSPICQQCHEDSRQVGRLVNGGTSAEVSPTVVEAWTADGISAEGDPRFQNFPHETENARMTVERGDDLCLNCHPNESLP